jgi:hypothetical protein
MDGYSWRWDPYIESFVEICPSRYCSRAGGAKYIVNVNPPRTTRLSFWINNQQVHSMEYDILKLKEELYNLVMKATTWLYLI